MPRSSSSGPRPPLPSAALSRLWSSHASVPTLPPVALATLELRSCQILDSPAWHPTCCSLHLPTAPSAPLAPLPHAAGLGCFAAPKPAARHQPQSRQICWESHLWYRMLEAHFSPSNPSRNSFLSISFPNTTTSALLRYARAASPAKPLRQRIWAPKASLQ